MSPAAKKSVRTLARLSAANSTGRRRIRRSFVNRIQPHSPALSSKTSSATPLPKRSRLRWTVSPSLRSASESSFPPTFSSRRNGGRSSDTFLPLEENGVRDLPCRESEVLRHLFRVFAGIHAASDLSCRSTGSRNNRASEDDLW